MIDRFLDQANLAPSSRAKYATVLRKFADAGLAPREFLAQWRERPTTLALHTTILNRYFGYLYDEGEIDENPMARIKRPKLRHAEDLDVTTVSSTDVAKLHAAARDWDERLCLATLTLTGARRSAAANARRGDVDLERGTVRFIEKGGKVIVKPLPNELVSLIEAADEAGVWESGTPDAYLIPSRRAPRGKTRSAAVVYEIVKRLGERAGVKVTPHALRAAFAVNYLDRFDGDTYGLQKLMGHRRPETTQVYLRRHDDFKAMEKVRELSWA